MGKALHFIQWLGSKPRPSIIYGKVSDALHFISEGLHWDLNAITSVSLLLVSTFIWEDYVRDSEWGGERKVFWDYEERLTSRLGEKSVIFKSIS